MWQQPHDDVCIFVVDHAEDDPYMRVREGLELLGNVLDSVAVMSGVADHERLLTQRLPSSAKPRQTAYVAKTLVDSVSADGKMLPSF